MRAARSTHAAVPLVQDADGDLRDRFTAAAFARSPGYAGAPPRSRVRAAA